MKFICAQPTLARALAIVQPAAGKTMLSNLDKMLLSAEDEKLKLEATDMALAIRCYIPATVQQSGSTASPAELLADLVKALDDNDVTAELNDESQVLTLSCGQHTARIHGVSAQEFPAVPAPTNEPTATIAPDILQSLIEQVTSAAATDEGRVVLNGVFLNSSGKELMTVAADGYRLAQAVATTQEEPPELEMIIPIKAIKRLRQLIADEEQPVALYAGKSHIIFRIQGGRGKLADITKIDLVARAIDGSYPDYKQLIPQSWTTQAVVNLEELTNALHPLLALVRDSDIAVALSFSAESITLSNKDKSQGSGRTTVTATVQGQEQRVALNPYYLRDALRSMSAAGVSRIALEMSQANYPVVMRPADDNRCLYLIMPMMSAWED